MGASQVNLSIKGTHKTIVDIEIDEKDAFRALENRLLNKYGLHRDQWVDEDGFLCEDDDSGPGRPWTQKLQKATPAQKKVLKTIEAFQQLLTKDVD